MLAQARRDVFGGADVVGTIGAAEDVAEGHGRQPRRVPFDSLRSLRAFDQ